MAKVLSKESTLFERDEKGELIPQVVNIDVEKDNPKYDELKDTQIKVTPMTRGEIKRIFSSLDAGAEKERDVDEEIIIKHCIEPNYTKEDIKFLKSEYSTPIVATILKISGLDTSKSKRVALEEAEEQFSKN